MIAVILAGGRGLRLWPESRRSHPKQLCKFIAGKTMLDHTIDRLVRAGAERLMIITNDQLRADIGELVGRRPDAGMIEILSEPEGKNTAPAVAMALARYGTGQEDAVLGIFPSDHHVLDEDGFIDSVHKAVQAAQQGRVATIGVAPDRPETGFGYIERSKWEVGELPDVFGVDSFREKPDLPTAQSYLDSGRYVWNSGIYVGKIRTLREEFARYLPDVYSRLAGGYEHYLRSYASLPDISLDYAIAEKSGRMAVVPGDFGWCDLGSWNALAQLSDQDEEGNVCLGSDVLALESQSCLVKQTGKTVVLFGVDNLLVVETGDVVLVADRERTQDVRHLVDLLQQRNRQDLL